MNLLCVDPVINSGKVSAFTVFDAEGKLVHSDISFLKTAEIPENYLDSKKYVYICFDIFKSLHMLQDKAEFIWDVKTLYELRGYKFLNIIELGTEIFGPGRMQNYVKISNTVKAHLRSYKESKINIGAYEAQELLPEGLIGDLYSERAQIVVDLFKNLEDGHKEFYKDFYKSIKVLETMSLNPLNINLEAIEGDDSHYAQAIRKNALDKRTRLQFNVVGAKTGRLGFRKGTINLYTMPKSLRVCIEPSKGCKLVEFDFKAFQPRIAIFSTKDEEFKNGFKDIKDIYSVFPGDREKNKIGFLAWMYAKSRVNNETFDNIAWPVWELRNQIYKESKEKGFLTTKWGRRLYWRDEPVHIVFQNFITATEVDCILNLSRELANSVKVLFPFHDAVVCEIPENKLEQLPALKEKCEGFLTNIFNANFPVGVKVGDNFRDMVERSE